MAIIVSESGKRAIKVEVSGVGEESRLQQYVADNPHSLPIDTLKQGVKLLVVAKEFGTRSGPIDVLAIDGDGDLYIIETKLYKNPDKRKVVAQMLDYGAALWKGYSNSDVFADELNSAMIETTSHGLTEALQRLYETDSAGASRIVSSVKRNLEDGNIRFVVLMDQLDERLRDLILFINTKSRFNIYAVEMEFYKHEAMEIVIPRIWGAEVKKDVGVARAVDPRYVWDEPRFKAELQASVKDAREVGIVLDLLSFFHERGEIEWKALSFQGGGKANVTLPAFGKRRICTLDTEGGLLVDFVVTGQAEDARQRREALGKALVAGGLFHADHCGEGTKPEMALRQWIEKAVLLKEAINRLAS